jgi:hypothetical protein
MNLKQSISLFKNTFNEWNEDKAPRLGAALAYYSVFSIAPLVMLAVGAASLIFGAEAAQGEVVDEIKDTVGLPIAKAVEEMLAQYGLESGAQAGPRSHGHDSRSLLVVDDGIGDRILALGVANSDGGTVRSECVFQPLLFG